MSFTRKVVGASLAMVAAMLAIPGIAERDWVVGALVYAAVLILVPTRPDTESKG